MQAVRIPVRSLPLVLSLSVATTLAPASAQEAPATDVGTEVIAAAQALVEVVPEKPGPVEAMGAYSRAEMLRRPFADAAREDWSYWPRPRAGLTVGQMDERQKVATQRLLASVLSSTGQLKVVQIMQLERILQALDTVGLPRETGAYSLVLFGEPSLDGPWGWRFEGHHVSLNLTMAPEGLRVTPSFLGSNPGEIRNGPLTGFRPLRLEEDLGRELVKSLSADERTKTVLSEQAPRDILTGTLGKPPEQWHDWKGTLKPDGIPVSQLSPSQQAIVIKLLAEVLGTYRPELVAHYRESIDLDSLSFAWLGGLESGEPHYYRLQGGDFVFEYDNVQGNANHIHTVWRDRSQDFGTDLLAEHYREHHH